MEIEKYLDAMKNVTLYAQKRQGGLSAEILSIANGRVNEPMARALIVADIYDNNLPLYLRSEVTRQVLVMNCYLDGWSVEKAIQAEGVSIQKENQQSKGLLSKLTGGTSDGK